MIDERHEELACLHALDLLEGEELRHFETRLAAEPGLQSLVRDLRQTAGTLSFLAPGATPPAALKERVFSSVAARSSGSGAGNLIFPASGTFARWLPWGVAASLALGLAWLGQLYLARTSEAELLRTRADLAAVTLESARQQAEAERIVRRQQWAGLEQQLAAERTQVAERDRRIAQLASDLKSQADLARLKITALASLLENSPKAIAVAVWDPGRQEGVLKVEKLPPLAPHQDYQLWVVDPQYANPVDGGVFTVNPSTGDARLSFRAKQSIGAVNAFAVTLERKGGVPKAEGPFVLLGK
jgi:anti-sigma-K factor RskA